MSRFNFIGDTDSVAPAQLEFIGEVLEEHGFKGSDVTVEPVGAAGDNYAANVKRIVITENGKTFKMIAKLASDAEIMRQMANMELMFGNENILYMELLPKFREMQIQAGVPEEDWFMFAKCYGSNTTAPFEIILLEDLKESNHVMLDRFKFLNNDCMKIVLKNVAVYHSLSLVLKNREPETFAKLSSSLKDMFLDGFGSRPEMSVFTAQIEEQALSVVQEEKYKRLIRGSMSRVIEYATDMKNKMDPKYSVIQQGDGWTNNVMFQMNGDTPKSCVLIDYQLAKESSQAYDIMYSLFNSTSHEQRQKHFHEFIDHYHSEMAKSLKYFDLEISDIYPRQQLDNDLKTYAKFMFAICVMVSSSVVRNTEDAAKMKDAINTTKMEDVEKAMESLLVSKDEVTNKYFKNRLEGIADSLLEIGLL